jgi:ABC-type amino acid transport substrate-binding protein
MSRDRSSREWKWLAHAAWLLGLLVGVGALVAILAPEGLNPASLLPGRDGTWERMQARGVWRVGLDPSFPPFESLDEEGRPVGYDVDLARRMAAEWGVEAEIVAMGYDSLLDALQADRVDSVVSALPYDPRETKDFRFSPPYFEAGIRLAVPAGSPIDDVDKLDGHRVAVEWGSMGDMVGRRLKREGAAIELVQVPTPEDVLDALAAGEADAALIDNVTLRQAQGRGAQVVAVGPALESNPYVIASPHKANKLGDQIAETLARLQENGVMTDLEETWFGPQPTP